jgi:hypothetical protein
MAMMRLTLAALAVAASAFVGACAVQPSPDGNLMADGEKRECVTGRTICRKPDPNAISDVRTVSGQAARDAANPSPNPGPTPGRGN